MSVSTDELAAIIAGLGPVTEPAPPSAGILACTVCGEWLDAVHRTIGTHPACEPTPAEVAPPASTIADLRSVLVDFEANSARSRQAAPGPSEIAIPCDRRLGYRVAGLPGKPDGRVKWAPLIGTAVHALIAEALAADNEAAGRERWLIEQRVQPGLGVSGSCDAYDTDTDTVVDWKVVGPTRLDHYRRHGPGPQYEGQIHIYGLGWHNAGRRPRWVRIVFLSRSTDYDDAYEWTAPYDRALAEAAIDRLHRITTLLSGLRVDANPGLWGAVPASPDSKTCRWCPYYRRGGPADETGCPGDAAADSRQLAKFTDGLIA